MKRRNPVSTAFEILLPIAFILIFVAIRTTVPDVDVPAGWSSSDDDVGYSNNLFETTNTPSGFLSTLGAVSLSVPRYVFTETTMAGLIMAMNLLSISESAQLDQLSQVDQLQCTALFAYQGYVSTDPASPFAIPSVCQDKVIPYKLAIAPDNVFTRDYFFRTVSAWHNRSALSPIRFAGQSVFTIASLEDSVVFFDSDAALEDYVAGDSYGTDVQHPKVYAGIVFNSYPTTEDQIGAFIDFDYSLRLNATRTDRDTPGVVPSTKDDRPPTVDTRQRKISTTEYFLYAVRGFMTLQTLVARFLNCMPEWDAEAQRPGACRATQSTSIVSEELDAKYYAQLENDLVLNAAISAFNQATPTEPVSWSTVPAADRENLLRPLRQAPQPYYGQQTYAMPVEEYKSSPFFDSIEAYFPLVFLLSYLYTVSRVLTVFIHEKETKTRELMKIMGVTEISILGSWYVTYFLIGLMASVLQASAAVLGLFSNSNFVLIFLYFYLFSLDVLAFGHMISTFFSKAKTGAFFGMALFFMFYFVSSGYTTTSSEASKNAASVLSPVALAFGAQVLASAEANGIGITFATLTESFANYRFINCLLFMAFDFVLYAALALYFEQVVPQEYGTTRPWHFLFTRRFTSKTSSQQQQQQRSSLLNDNAVEEQGSTVAVVGIEGGIEPVSAELRQQEDSGQACVIANLRKVFSVPGGEAVAVKGLNLKLYEGQITCLLGHNGAGKTTTISMLTGMIAPTSGDALVNGVSIAHDIDRVRQSVGMCPQHDVLYAELTVREHLLFYARLKGFDDQELEDEVDKKIREVGLTEKKNVRSDALSGGMKRKLSVAIALIGDSKVVFLDEPTSGMDPYSRRSTWELLQNNRHGRVMVLTTHFMDEADLLGDRIAIMSHGELKCCGSSLFLKNRYGAGYNLTMVKREACETARVVGLVKEHVPAATVLSNVGTEISFQLPLDAAGRFAKMFRQLDQERVDDRFGIAQYGISITTMEEVFMKVAEQGDVHDQALLREESKSSSARRVALESDPTPPDAGGGGFYRLDAARSASRFQMFWIHLRALLLKRFNNAKRDKRALLFSIVLPVLLLLIGLALLKSTSLTSDAPDYVLNTGDYGLGTETPTPYACQGTGNACSATMDTFFSGATGNAVPSLEPYETDSPTVFGVTYTDPSINRTGTTGYALRFGQQVFQLGYGTSSSGAAPVVGQYGGYLIQASETDNTFGYNTIVNTTSKHAGPIFKSLMDQAIYRSMAQSSELQVTVHSHPLPLTASTKALFNAFLSFTAVTFIAIAFAFYPAAIVTSVVKEKEASRNAKHQQLVSGVSVPAFWLSNYLWDVLVYIIPYASALILIQAFDITSLTGSDACSGTRNCTEDSFAAVIVLFGLFGLAIAPLTYVTSYAFKSHTTAQNATFMLHFVIGVVLLVTSFVLDVVDDDTISANRVLKFFWRLSPLFCLCNGLLNLTRTDILNSFGVTDSSSSAFDMDIAGWEMLYLALQVLAFGTLTIAIDLFLSYPRLRARLTRDPVVATTRKAQAADGGEDSDVEAERVRVVQSGHAEATDIVKLEGLRKVYRGGKVAVRDLSFGLTKGECFGFLGINGAGKTTTLKMLTGDVLPTNGTAFLHGLDIMSQQLEIRRVIGYCPQFDALLDLLTVREHLELFGRIKGIPSADLELVVQEKLRQMDLTEYETKLAGSLSGGNKRKLSVAIAMIGSPPIMFLDEPSTGMDPVSRRFMWEVISRVSTELRESTIILTTHSMEECEALCTKVGIMVGGALRCLGSIQYLKGKYGDGLVLEIKCVEAQESAIQQLLAGIGLGGEQRLTRGQVVAACVDLKDAERQHWIASDHQTGWLLQEALTRDGEITAKEFADWWIGETRFMALMQYLRQSFGAAVQLVERHNQQSRFKLPRRSDLATVFDSIESQKETLSIKEYSVSQTTLEQIFNQFASQQHEEQGVARGLTTTTRQLPDEDESRSHDGYTQVQSP